MALHATQMADSEADAIDAARAIIAAEAACLLKLSRSLDNRFVQAVQMILKCSGKVLVTGMGKAGLVGQKLAASFASTGTPSLYFHPAEAVHGDLGCISPADLIVVLSYSGETEEVVRILPQLKTLSAGVLALTSRSTSMLGRAAMLTLELGPIPEAGELSLAPSSTTTAMMAMGDALALVVSQQRGFTRDQFARFHPAGNLGRMLSSVRDVMRPLSECRVAKFDQSLRQVLVTVSRPGRRTGAIMLIDASGQLAGIFTDSDLARLLEGAHDAKLDAPISQVMTRQFTTIQADQRLPDAMQLLAERKISELPVVDPQGFPLGLIDITDLVAVVASDGEPRPPASDGIAADNAPSPSRSVRPHPNLRIIRE